VGRGKEAEYRRKRDLTQKEKRPNTAGKEA
jgi:hypothetical protein